jgi:geranylgeranyl reductase family protein
MYDIQVIGGGPTGCIAAREAAKRNLKVTVFEEHERIGSQLKCSGLLSKKGLDGLEIDYRKAILNEIRGAKIYSPSLNEMRVVSPNIKAFVIDREKFDRICADEAEEQSVKILLGRRARKTYLKSNLIIGADGALSQVAAWFGFPKINEFAFCYQADFQNAHIEESEVVEVFLSNTLFPGFFGWSIPLNESEARVGLGVFRDVRKKYEFSVKRYFDNFTKKHPIVSKIIKNSKQKNNFSAIIPLSTRDKTSKSKVLLVGDAAGQVKATTGGGIIFGINCAKIAGKLAPQIIDGMDSVNYELRWREKFGRDLMLHKRIREMYNSMSDTQIDRYFSIAKKAGAEKFLVKHGDMDSPAAIIDAASSAMPLQEFLMKAFSKILYNGITRDD